MPGLGGGECGYDWAGSSADVIASIRSFPAHLSRLLRQGAVTDTDDRLRTRPAAETRSVLDYMAHVGEAIDWYANRVHRALTGPVRPGRVRLGRPYGSSASADLA